MRPGCGPGDGPPGLRRHSEHVLRIRPGGQRGPERLRRQQERRQLPDPFLGQGAGQEGRPGGGRRPGILEATGLRTLAYETALAYTRGITIEQLREGYAKTSTTPLGRSGKLTEVANTVAFLLSDRARYIHGVTINVAGGKTRG